MDNTLLDSVFSSSRNCSKCGLGRRVYDGLVSNVFLDKTRTAVFMMVGQSPSMAELKSGIGRGEAYDKFFEMFCDVSGLEREDIYLTHVCKCCTYGDRKPSEGEVKKCLPYLADEIKAVKPKFVVTLGIVPLKLFTGLSDISELHGKMLFSERFKVSVFPLYAPTLKRMMASDTCESFNDDLKALSEYIK